MATRILLLLMATAIWLACAGVSYGAIIINAPMTDTNSAGWVLGGTPTSSLLTGNGTIDPVGSGWLRLTNNSGNQTGFAYNTTSFDLSQGVLIQFDYATWGGTGADGYSVYLFDAGVSAFNIGAFGGSLGYAQKLPPAVTTAVPGISGGYVGVGVDEYGNFSNPTEGRYLGPGAYPNTVTVRGSVVGFGGGAIGDTINASAYPWVATSANNGSLWYNGATRPDQTSTNYRKVVILISPAPNPVVNAWIQFGYNQPLTQMITNQTLPAISTSQLLHIGYAASTGGSTNYHEIRNLLVTSLNTSTGIDLGITKSVLDTTTNSTMVTAVGDGIRYTVTARNYGPNNVTATGVGIVDNVLATITGVTWTCAVVSGSPTGTSCGAASGSGNNLNTTANLPYGGAVTYIINGTVGASAPSTLSNTASLVIPGSIVDYNSANNSATVSIPVTSNLSTSTKTVVDTTSSGAYAAGDVLQYTITLKESSGAAASGVSVTDTIDTNLTGLTVVSYPAGATNSSTTSALNITGISIPANGSVTIVYTATISSSATPGTTINNTATITNPNGIGATPTAPVVTVSGIITSSGTKQIYLNGTNALSRTMPTASTTTFVDLTSGSSATWALTTATAKAITLSSSFAVYLQMRRPSMTGNRTLTLTIDYVNGASTVTLGTYNVPAFTMTNAATPVLYGPYAVPLSTSPVTIPVGSTLRLTVKNTSAAGYLVDVYPNYNSAAYANVSRIQCSPVPVINVDSIGLYSAAYNGGSIVSSVAPGATVYIRTQVSDPFGYADISGATITIIDSGGTVRVAATALDPTYLKASSGAIKTYEYAYTVPATGVPVGVWSIKIIAAEGAEGIVTDTAYATMPVAIPPVLTVVKSASPSSVAPGGVVTYTVVVTNTGAGTATSVVATDFVPTYTAYVTNSTRLNSITVAGDGITLPLIAGLLVDDNVSRGAGVAATGILPAGKSATITFQVTVK